MRLAALTLAVLCAAASPAVSARADVEWRADPARSSVTLTVSRLLAPRVTGHLPIAYANVVTGDGATIPRSVVARLDAAALDTGDAARDAQLRGGAFFNTRAYPAIDFSGRRIVPTSPHAFAIDGTLTMRGVTHPLHLDVHEAGELGEPGGARRIRYIASGRFRRSDFGMTSLRGLVGNTVALTIVLETVSR
ncbi:polyisoprenoid-binding protein [Vulcanimicrobium alpinum]|uniref:Polyisoprenoid-binding protein n=1 Tax=Vulcanimicrobium alpinum TaxID=3016050 RepID=A0AAN2CBJ4_UNVUL|nr:YceI family protein [Vulcanimicrobium alpinum]BDE07857.1 polyisoprenoid-binding protein [Vulcanimicrobium alpinum]